MNMYVENDYEIQNVAKEIELYLSMHPNAADTLEGVVKWWLTRQRYEESMNLVSKALEYLINQGKVLKSFTSGGRPVFSSIKK